MNLYLRTKFQVFSITLTSFRRGSLTPYLQNKPQKDTPRLGLTDCEIILNVTWCEDCAITSATGQQNL